MSKLSDRDPGDVINEFKEIDQKEVALKPHERVQYTNPEGRMITLRGLVIAEPDWAVSRINFSVDRIHYLEGKERDLHAETVILQQELMTAKDLAQSWEDKYEDLKKTLSVAINQADELMKAEAKVKELREQLKEADEEIRRQDKILHSWKTLTPVISQDELNDLLDARREADQVLKPRVRDLEQKLREATEGYVWETLTNDLTRAEGKIMDLETQLKTATGQAASVGRVNVQNNELHGELNELKVEARDLRVRSVELDAALRNLGYCTKCMQVAEHDIEGPFSHCGCGTGEDYGTHLLQTGQLAIAKVVRLDEEVKGLQEETKRLRALQEQTEELEAHISFLQNKNVQANLQDDGLQKMVEGQEELLQDWARKYKLLEDRLKAEVIVPEPPRYDGLTGRDKEIQRLTNRLNMEVSQSGALQREVYQLERSIKKWRDTYKLLEGRLKGAKVAASAAITLCGDWAKEDGGVCPTCGIPHGKQEEVRLLKLEVADYRDRLQRIWTWHHNCPSAFYDWFDDEDRLL